WEITTKHVHFDWEIDWKQRVLTGGVTHKLVAQRDAVDKILLDTMFLDIKSVAVDGRSVEYKLHEAHEVMGAALEIPLNPTEVKSGNEISLKVDYSTTNKCTAIGWLEKEQTAGKKFDFLFSQCQPIYARSLGPLQDSPSVKITYSANVRSVLPALMSALRVSPPSETIHGGKEIGKDVVEYQYNQPVAIPSYLIAIASGNLVYKPFEKLEGKAWTTGVWSEPETIEASYWEFHKDTAHYVATAERLVTPYEFGVYDVLVLPPSFPYGGMENACLTFLTPTLLAGDRSLVDVVAHEASHSWFGNNVTTADSGHFWLNEGFTTYLERILQGELHGPAERDFSYIIGRKSLLDALKGYAERPKYQRLVIPYTFGEDPDDAYSTIPYEKGSNFLLYLERQLGGLDVILPYLQDYVKTFRGKSIRTDDWKAHLFKYFEANGGKEKVDILNKVDFEAWLHGEGLDLPVPIPYDTTLAQKAYDLARAWDESRSKDTTNLPFSESDLKDFSSNQIVVFLESLQSLSSPLPATHIRYMNRVYPSFNMTGNAETRSRWYELALASDAAGDFVQNAADWVGFTKAIMRTPHMMTSKVGMSKKSNDPEFDEFNRHFTAVEGAAEQLLKDSKAFTEAVNSLLVSGSQFAVHFAAIFSPLGNEYNLEGKHPESASTIHNAEGYQREMEDLKLSLAPELELIQSRIVGPIGELQTIMKQIRKNITKRDHKLVDYDRHNNSLTKLREKKEKTLSDEKNLFKLEQDFEQAVNEYETYNNALKTDLPAFLQLATRFIDPLFHSFYYMQLNIFYLTLEKLNGFCEKKYETSGTISDIASSYETRRGDAREKSPPPPPMSAGAIPPPPYSAGPNANSVSSFAAAKKAPPPPPPVKPKPSPAAKPVIYVTALYDFDAQADGDLSFRAGDKIELVERSDSAEDWWTGKLNGKQGVFPGNYVQA
ncbi:hypothetical protein FRB99_007980, partial [Tulasnella sp. 403]